LKFDFTIHLCCYCHKILGISFYIRFEGAWKFGFGVSHGSCNSCKNKAIKQIEERYGVKK